MLVEGKTAKEIEQQLSEVWTGIARLSGAVYQVHHAYNADDSAQHQNDWLS